MSWGQEYKFLLRNPRVLLALVQTLLSCIFYLKSLVIVTPRYLMLSTFSKSVPSNVYETWIFFLDPFSCQLHHIAFDRLKSHTPFPCPGTQSINIPLKFYCVFFILNFMITNTVISKQSDSVSDEMSFMYRENNKGPRKVPWGTPDKTGAQSDFTPFTTTLCCQKLVQCLAINSIAKQFTFKEFMRGWIKRLFKIQYECVNLSSIVQDFSSIIYYCSQLSFITMYFPECMLPVWQELISIKISHDIWTYYVFQ